MSGQHAGIDLPSIPPLVVFGHMVHQGSMNTQGLAGIAKRRSRLISGHRCGQCRPLTAIFLINVLNDFLAPLMLKIHINIGRFIALFGNKALKKHAHAGRIDFGNAQAITDRRVGGRSPALAENSFAAGKVHDVIDR